MAKNRKTWTSKQKFEVAIQLVMGRMTQSQITSEYGVHPTQQKQRKDELLIQGSSIFETKKDDEKIEQQKKIEKLHKIIGQYAVEVDWLQKKIDGM